MVEASNSDETLLSKKTEMHFVNYLNISESQAKMLASVVSVDKTNYSVSFNEFLTLMSHQQESEPDHETLVDVFE